MGKIFLLYICDEKLSKYPIKMPIDQGHHQGQKATEALPTPQRKAASLHQGL